MSALHGAARRLAGLLNDAQAAGVSIAGGEWCEEYTVKDGKLSLTVEQDKTGKWGVRDA